MKDISERVSYLQGLSEGLNLSESTPYGKIISGTLNVMNEMADMIKILQMDFDEFKEYVESIDDDLLEMEEFLFDNKEEDMDYITLECQGCGKEVFFDSDIVDDEDTIEITCPNCSEVVFIHDGSFDFEHNNNQDDLNLENNKQN